MINLKKCLIGSLLIVPAFSYAGSSEFSCPSPESIQKTANAQFSSFSNGILWSTTFHGASNDRALSFKEATLNPGEKVRCSYDTNSGFVMRLAPTIDASVILGNNWVFSASSNRVSCGGFRGIGQCTFQFN